MGLDQVHLPDQALQVILVEETPTSPQLVDRSGAWAGDGAHVAAVCPPRDKSTGAAGTLTQKT